MKWNLLLIFYLINFIVKGQSSCTPTVIAGEVYYPNTINTGPPNVNYDIQYLCGPNTVLYDTIQQMCRQVYVDNFSTLFLVADCPAVQQIWLKSNCTLNILNGPSVIIVHLEPGAIINQPLGPHSYYITLDTCSSIVYPNVNCATSVRENTIDNFVRLSPNPNNGTFNIISEHEIKMVEIMNVNGQVLQSFLTTVKETNVDINNLDKGIYFAKIIHSNGSFVTKKIVIY